MASIPIGFSMDEDDIKLVEKAAEKENRSRSNFIASAAIARAKEVMSDE